MADKVTIEFGRTKPKKKKPGQNKDGGKKKPSQNPGGDARPQLSPAANPAGGINPLTHPSAPQMTVNAEAPIQDPSGKPSPLQPTPTQDTRQVRHNINFKDLPPAGQNALMEQQGMDLDAPRKMLEQNTMGAIQQGPSQGPVPNALVGPGVPPGVESLPDDIMALQQMMQQGYAPGANPQETALGQNADALMKAKAGMQNAQLMAPVAPEPMAPPAGPPQLAPTGPPIGPTAEAPTTPGAPGGIPPELIAALAEEAKKKRLKL